MTRLLSLLALLAVAPLAPSASVAPPAAEGYASVDEPDTDSLLVVVLGSSTAAGTGPSHRDSTWVERFRRHLRDVDARFAVLNLARGGYTTFHLMPAGTTGVPEGLLNAPDPGRNIDAALARDPVAIVINLPSNDVTVGVGTEVQMANFAVMVARAEAAGVPVWITTTQPRDLEPAQVAVQQVVRDAILARYGDRAIDFWTGFADPDGQQADRWGSGDHVHYNDAAHRVFADRVRASGLAETVLAGD